MFLVFVKFLLLLDSFQLSGAIKFNFKNALPWNWRDNLEDTDIMNLVALRLVNKDWKPKGPSLPKGDRICGGKATCKLITHIHPTYPGSVSEAFEIFQGKENLYDFVEKPLHSAIELLTEGGYNKNQGSIFILHTISGGAENNFVKNMIMALSMRNFMKEYNVFAFNMLDLQPSMEKTVIRSIFGHKANFEHLGTVIGGFFNTAIANGLMGLDQIHFLGYCYSSQLAAYIARYISSTNNGHKIRSITALDPYSIGLSGIRNKVLNKDDADLVFVYHTNSIAYGSLYRRATADFVLNGGWFQPGCYTSTSVQCSHRRIVSIFWYVILYPDLWMARRCSNWFLFKSCLCNWNEKAELPFPPVDGIKGKYYLNTMGKKPYGYGKSGANCYTSSRVAMKSNIRK